MPQIYANRLDLDRLPVFLEGDGSNPMFFNINGFPEIFSFGKHYGTLSIIDSSNTPYELRSNSRLQIEAKDRDGTLIYTDATEDFILDSINGAIIFYIWVKEDPLRTHKDIKSGTGTLTIVGELDNVPPQWKYKPNYRCTFPINIRTDLPNTSPILFQDINSIQVSSSFSESIDLDIGDSNYNRSYLNISASHLETYGGKVDRIELSYREARSQNNEYTVLTTYTLNSSVYELSDTGSVKGLNPISDLQKFPTPKDIRRNGNVDFRLRFLNSNGEFAQDINQNNIDVQITGSITGFTGSAFILETDDNLITGSGKLVFGKSLTDGVHMVSGIDKAGRQTINYNLFEGGIKTKNVFTVGENVTSDDERNIVDKSSGSAILGSTESEVSQSNFSIIVGGTSGSMKKAPVSVIVGGLSSLIENPDKDTIAANAVIGGTLNKISGSADESAVAGIIIGGSQNLIQANTVQSSFPTIIGGLANKIFGTSLCSIIGGQNQRIGDVDPATARSAIIGGSGNHVNHTDSVIIGMVSKNSTAINTVYVQNLEVDGTITANEFHTSVTSASIIYESGSTQFGDSADDTHTFTGNITASGNISGSLTTNLTIGGDISANSGSFNYITASIVDVNADTIRFGGESFTKSNVVALKAGKTLKAVAVGRNHPDIVADDGDFEGNITAIGNISSSGTVYAASGSYNYMDAPGSILGYTAIGIDAAKDSVSVGATFAVTDADHKVTFFAPPSGKVEIEVDIYAIAIAVRWMSFGLSDNATYAAIHFPNTDDVTNEHRLGDVPITSYATLFPHKWVVEGLTVGTSYTWYLGAKAEQAGRITLHWGGDAVDEFPPFIMKATALPANIYTG